MDKDLEALRGMSLKTVTRESELCTLHFNDDSRLAIGVFSAVPGYVENLNGVRVQHEYDPEDEDRIRKDFRDL